MHDLLCRVAAQAEAPTTPGTFAPGRAACKSVSRIVFNGELSPQSGAADLLIAVANWAEQHPDHLVQVWWVGEGDLVGVLDAQPLPPSVTQRFLGCLEPLAAEDILSQCTLLAVPSLTEHRASPVAQAMAAGLPVLGSRLDREVRRFVREGANGWLYNPLRPDELSAALDRALATPAAVLAQMGGNASAAVRATVPAGLSERVVRAIATITPDFVPECPGEAFAQPAR